MKAVETELYEYAVLHKCDLEWDDKTCYVLYKDNRYAVTMLGNWPKRVRDQIDWNYKKHLRDL